MTRLKAATEQAQFDLTLHAIPRQGQIVLTMLYNTDLFDESTIQRMLGHYQTLLEAAVSHPDERISRLNLMDDEQRRQVTRQWPARRASLLTKQRFKSCLNVRQNSPRTPWPFSSATTG